MGKRAMIIVVITGFSLIPGFFVMHIGYGFYIMMALFLWCALLMWKAKYKKRNYIFLLANGFLFIPIFKTIFTITSYFNGTPTLTYCQRPFGKYHPVYRMNTYNCDCEMGVSEEIMFTIDNYVTYTLFDWFGYTKNAYRGPLPLKETIDKSFFADGYQVISFNNVNEYIVLENDIKIPMDEFYMDYWVKKKHIVAPKYYYKYISDDLYGIGIFNDKEELHEVCLYLIPKKKVIQAYDYMYGNY